MNLVTKPVRFLPISLNKRLPHTIETAEGYTYDNKIINYMFRDFYSSVYSSCCTFDSFFQNLNMPICEKSKNILGNPITVEELNVAIKTLQSGKSAGPDGFPSELFKKFSTHLIPHMLNMYNESLVLGVLPQSLSEALGISLSLGIRILAIVNL